MPIYEYECKDCGRRREILHKTRPVTDTDECDICEGVMNRILSVPAPADVKGFNEKNGYSNAGKKPKKEKDI